MAIIAFWSDNEKETGQTMSMAAITTYMAVEHNYKILALSTLFNDKTLEGCFWDLSKTDAVRKSITQEKQQVALDSGIEGLEKAITSNRINPSIITDYSKIIFKDRLEVLVSPKTEDYNEYQRVRGLYPDVLQNANKYYDLIFIDVNKGFEDPMTLDMLQRADVIIVNLTQKQKTIDDFMALRDQNILLKDKKVMLLLGRYDKFSKYNTKNVTRYIGEKKELCTVPYNTLFFEACAEGKVADYFLRFRNLDEMDRNTQFINGIQDLSKKLIYRLQELQMKM